MKTDGRKAAKLARAEASLARMAELADGLDLVVEYDPSPNSFQVFRVVDDGQLDSIYVFESVNAHSVESFLRGVQYALEVSEGKSFSRSGSVRSPKAAV